MFQGEGGEEAQEEEQASSDNVEDKTARTGEKFETRDSDDALLPTSRRQGREHCRGGVVL